MAPIRLLVLRMVDDVAKIEAKYIAVSKLVLEGYDYGCLGLLLGEIFINFVVLM